MWPGRTVRNVASPNPDDANWQSRATALFTATGAPQGLAIRVEVWAAATDLKLAKYGYNYDASRARYPALGRLRITTVQPLGQPPVTAVEIAAPEVFSMLDAVAAGAGESGAGQGFRRTSSPTASRCSTPPRP